MKRLVITAAALLILASVPQNSRACKKYGNPYVTMPFLPGGSPAIGGLSFGAPFTGYSSFGYSAAPAFSFGLPATGYNFGLPATGYGFGAPATGYSLGLPATGYSYGALGSPFSYSVIHPGFGAANYAASADAQGLFGQIILPILLQRFLNLGRGGDPTRASFTDEDIRKVANAISSQSGIKDVNIKLDTIEKNVKALVKHAGVKPEAELPIPKNTPVSSPTTEELRAGFHSLVAEIQAKQAAPKAPFVASPNKSEKLRAEFKALVAEIEAKQAGQRKVESVSNRPLVSGAK